jgi:predicted RNA-binding Zn ribbon-like protein
MTASRSLPHRIGGNLSLDLANTITWRGTGREFDHLADPDAVIAWASEVGLVAEGMSLKQDERVELVEDIHRLRDAVQEAGAAVAAGQRPPASALATIRDTAARSLANADLAGAPAKLIFCGADRIVGTIAWAAFDLLRGDELGRLKQCPTDDCRWLFIDRTKNGSRRWCDMATCGDRAKKRRSR